MKKVIPIGYIFAVLLLLNSPASGLDPYARESLGTNGMIQVKTPDASKDEIILTHVKTGKVEPIKSGKVEIVPSGSYRLKVNMEGEVYNGKATVRPTERTDVLVGYGKLKIKGPRSAMVQVFDKKQGKLIAEFPANKTQLLPRGSYEVKVKVNGVESSRSDVLVVGSKTSIVKVSS